MRLSNVTIWTRDPHALKDWYRQNFGLRVVEETPRFVLLEADGGAGLVFHVGEPLATPDRVQFHLEVEDVDREYRRLRDEGVAFDETPADRPWGVRSATTRDPAGHSVEITTRRR
jgi:catechol 2,3-dioxygenase-like lactoylglutathione lyase family enzyme